MRRVDTVMREFGRREIFANNNTETRHGVERVRISASDLNNGVTPHARHASEMPPDTAEIPRNGH
jgi:hypothetical protein